jgi:radical SAM superfamily enzyme YgiQ (UPF0313 family)
VIGLRPYPRYHGNVIRPPSEANSLILQVMYGCSHGKCAFCGSYLGKAFRLRAVDAIKEDIENLEEGLKKHVTKVFLCDGDVLALPRERMVDILDALKAELPSLARVSGYVNAHSLQRFSVEELRDIREHGLELLYVGLESGDDATLLHSGKGLSSGQQIRAFLRAKEAGMALSVTAILGLGGVARSEQHARATGQALTTIDPDYIGILSLMLEPGTRMEEAVRRGALVVPDARGLLRELRELIAETDVTQAVFRTNHASNYLALGGTLPADKPLLLDTLDEILARGDLAPLRPEDLRAL